ncbi:MAG: NifU family protein [Cyclobacteriaceae bacterium]
MEQINTPVTVYTESSPNPNSLKFVCEFPLIDGSIDFPSLESASASPLAQELFGSFDFIQRVFIAANFVTVTKTDKEDWFEVAPPIKSFIQKYLEEKKPVIDDKALEELKTKKEALAKASEALGTDNETIAKIQVVLDDYIKPAVESDGGAISLHSFENGVVKVLLQGSCSGCPSSTMTLKGGIENLLRKMVPEVKEVIAEGV